MSYASRAAFEKMHPRFDLAREDATGYYADAVIQSHWLTWCKAREHAIDVCNNSELYWARRGNIQKANAIASIRTNFRTKL